VAPSERSVRIDRQFDPQEPGSREANT